MCVHVNIQMLKSLAICLNFYLSHCYILDNCVFHKSVVNIFVLVKVSESMAPREVSQLT